MKAKDSMKHFSPVAEAHCYDQPMNVPNVALPVPEIRGVAENPQLRGRGGHRGSGMVLFERT